MSKGTGQSARTSSFTSTITQFINERREAKLKGVPGDDNATVAAKYDYGTWLADAARRVTQIQAVTHVLKGTHPDARGTSLYIEPGSMVAHAEVGSHMLGDGYATDIVGNAAALDVYKFLKLEVDGQRILDWLQSEDSDLLAALSPDPSTAYEWATAFKGLIRPSEQLSSHELAKQVYWSVSGDPTDDSGFHLLQPMFPSSLVHAIHADINDARFGEDNKEARQAWRDKSVHSHVYRDYRQLVARKLGGTKPQNISQLNSERGGVNYLLASLPPTWGEAQPKPLLKIDSALSRFRYFEGVDQQIKALCALLEGNPQASVSTRRQRERIEKNLGRSLAAFGLSISAQFPVGWSRDSSCWLPAEEQFWLDPNRAKLPEREGYDIEDQEFSTSHARGEWLSKVAQRFGNWLNAILVARGLPVGDAEHAHWANVALEQVSNVAPHPALEVQHG